MDLSLPALTDPPSSDEVRLSLLRQTARKAVSHQLHDYPLQAHRATVRSTGWRKVLHRSHRTVRMWQLVDSPFDGLCVGEDIDFYQLVDVESPHEAKIFMVEDECTPHQIGRITEILFEMCAPARW